MSRGAARELAESRASFERRVAQLRDALSSEFGREPKSRGWILPAAAAAAGLVVAWRVTSEVRRRRLKGES